MKLLVTGGAGFIGSHLADALTARGDQVIALDNCSTGSAKNVAHLKGQAFELVQGSILDETLVRDLARDVDWVVHLAAAVGVYRIIERPLESLLTNIKGTEIVLEATADAGKSLLLTSTSEIYGKNDSGPLSEDSDRILGSPFKSRWSYSTAKAVDEILAYNYWQTRGMPAVVVRLFNCVGARQTGAYGMVIPRLIEQALEGRDLTVFGDGLQRRSFCHVADTVEALLTLIEHPGAVGDVFNVGAANEMTINDLALKIIAMTGSASHVVHIAYDEAYEQGFEDMPRRLPDITKIGNLTGWKPRRTIDEILRDTIDASSGPVRQGAL